MIEGIIAFIFLYNMHAEWLLSPGLSQSLTLHYRSNNGTIEKIHLSIKIEGMTFFSFLTARTYRKI